MTTFHIDSSHYATWSQLERAKRMNKYLIAAHIAMLIIIALMMLFY